MAQRLDLQTKLRGIAPKVWYQKPPDNKMSYPCIVYKSTEPRIIRADNRGYLTLPGYEVLYITADEYDEIWDIMTEQFANCSVGRKYVSDQLYHYVFTIYY